MNTITQSIMQFISSLFWGLSAFITINKDKYFEILMYIILIFSLGTIYNITYNEL